MCYITARKKTVQYEIVYWGQAGQDAKPWDI